MTALTNRGLALKLAVEHVTDSGAYDLMQSDTDLQSVFGLADKFAAWIGGQDAPTESTPATATEETRAAERTANDAVEGILAGLDREAANLGAEIVNSARTEVGRLRRAARFQDVIDASLRTIDLQATYLGQASATRLRTIVRAVR